MLRYAADENLNGDIVRVQDAGLSGADDPTVLEWTALHGRLLLTHDVSTLTRHAFDRVRSGRPMPGVFEIPSTAGAGAVIDGLILLAECSHDGEWEGQVLYLPLK
jgi:Domain of unknown function (DUF5615)